jgi:hypothetical protein
MSRNGPKMPRRRPLPDMDGASKDDKYSEAVATHVM